MRQNSNWNRSSAAILSARRAVKKKETSSKCEYLRCAVLRRRRAMITVLIRCQLGRSVIMHGYRRWPSPFLHSRLENNTFHTITSDALLCTLARSWFFCGATAKQLVLYVSGFLHLVIKVKLKQRHMQTPSQLQRSGVIGDKNVQKNKKAVRRTCCAMLERWRSVLARPPCALRYFATLVLYMRCFSSVIYHFKVILWGKLAEKIQFYTFT